MIRVVLLARSRDSEVFGREVFLDRVSDVHVWGLRGVASPCYSVVMTGII